MTIEKSLKLILLKKCLLVFFGPCAGDIIAAGAYVSPAIIDVFVRLMGKTGTRKHILLYEIVIILGGVLGNILGTYEFPAYMGSYLGILLIRVYGLSVGIFVDYLVVSLAETLKALPVISRRIHLAVGLRYLISTLAAGKMAGSLAHFWNHIAPFG